jgi:predicted esterase
MAEAILLLGGHGSTPSSRAALEDVLRQAVGPEVVVHSAAGPVDVGDGTAWWDGELAEEDWPALASQLDDLASARGFVGRSLVVAGFSQGGAAALAWAASGSRRQPLAGVVCVAGFLPGCVAAALRPGAPVLLAALVVITAEDDVVDPFLGAVAARMLSRAGADVTVAEVDAGHEWTPAATAAVVEWLAKLGG